jgi:hypothetical protein
MRGMLYEHIFVDRYEFHLNPRRFLRRSAQTLEVRRSFSLDEILGAHTQQRLVAVCDGECFIDPNTKRAFDWVDQFRRLRLRILLTPRPPEAWDGREAELMRAGFFVLPLNLWGMGAFVDLCAALSSGGDREQPGAPVRPAAERGRAVPYFIRSRYDELISSKHSLDERDMRKLLRALRGYLRDRGFQWLMAYAVFPTLHPRLTLHLGSTVLTPGGESLADDNDPDGFLALSRLPWFIQGRMPDWLRQALVRSMPELLQAEVRRSLDELLSSSEQEAASRGVTLDIVDSTPPNYRKALEATDDEAPANKLPRDFLFLGFMAGESADALTVEAPAALRRQRMKQLLRVPALVTGGAALVAMLLGVAWPLYGVLQPTMSSYAEGVILTAVISTLVVWWADSTSHHVSQGAPQVLRDTRILVYGLVVLAGPYVLASGLNAGASSGIALGLATLTAAFVLIDRFSDAVRGRSGSQRFAASFMRLGALVRFLLWFAALQVGAQGLIAEMPVLDGRTSHGALGNTLIADVSAFVICSLALRIGRWRQWRSELSEAGAHVWLLLIAGVVGYAVFDGLWNSISGGSAFVSWVDSATRRSPVTNGSVLLFGLFLPTDYLRGQRDLWRGLVACS